MCNSWSKTKERLFATRALVLVLTSAIIQLATLVHAQDQPPAPEPAASSSPGLGAYDWIGRVGLTCGAGVSAGSATTKPTAQCGALFSLPYFDLEAGIMGPQASRNPVSGYLSTNLWIPLMPVKESRKIHGLPLLVGGYNRMFETGHALDYGLAFARPIDEDNSIQFEARDYWTFSKPDQHNIVFRVVWLFSLPDC